jgi:mRNA-degrading endonuclease HigB of HigAB toxin-antitoxin module
MLFPSTSAAANLTAWISVASAAGWQSITDVRQVFPHADLATVRGSKTVTIFNMPETITA